MGCRGSLSKGNRILGKSDQFWCHDWSSGLHIDDFELFKVSESFSVLMCRRLHVVHTRPRMMNLQDQKL